jgi:hypothetical protein
MRSLGGQHKAHIARRLFQGLEQSVGRHVVHALGREDQDRLAAPSGIGALRKLHRIAHGFDPDFFAGFAFFVVNVGLRLFRQRPAQFHHLGFGHQHGQIGMGAHRNRMAAGAIAASTLLTGLFAKPGRGQCQGQLVLAQARWPLQKPGVAALSQQIAGLASDPRRIQNSSHTELLSSQG